MKDEKGAYFGSKLIWKKCVTIIVLDSRSFLMEQQTGYSISHLWISVLSCVLFHPWKSEIILTCWAICLKYVCFSEDTPAIIAYNYVVHSSIFWLRSYCMAMLNKRTLIGPSQSNRLIGWEAFLSALSLDRHACLAFILGIINEGSR